MEKRHVIQAKSCNENHYFSILIIAHVRFVLHQLSNIVICESVLALSPIDTHAWLRNTTASLLSDVKYAELDD